MSSTFTERVKDPKFFARSSIVLSGLLYCTAVLSFVRMLTSEFKPVNDSANKESEKQELTKGRVYVVSFVLLWLWRYVRFIVNIVSSWTFQPVMPKSNPSYLPNDCTVVLATIDGKNKIFDRCVLSILANRPRNLIIVVPVDHAQQMAARYSRYRKVRILGSPMANKRFQQVCGLKEVDTQITVFCDDDVIWPSEFLHYSLAVFEDKGVGAGGTCQRLLRECSPSIWNFFGAAYLERRNFEFSATTHIDGGTSALSGRTQLIRTDVIHTNEFMEEYLGEQWLGCVPLMTADDDNFITRWLVNHGWKIRIQYCPEVELQTTLEDNVRFLGQCVRWYRTTWRSNVTSLFVDRIVWAAQPWCTYALYLSTFNPPAAIMDGGLLWLLLRSTQIYWPGGTQICTLLFVMWLTFTKTVKLIPHFWRYPEDLTFVPMHILFGYFHGFIKLYSLLTITSTQWYGRANHESIASEPRATLAEAVGIEGSKMSQKSTTEDSAGFRVGSQFARDSKKRGGRFIDNATILGNTSK